MQTHEDIKRARRPERPAQVTAKKETVLSWTPQAMAQEVGTVLTVGENAEKPIGAARFSLPDWQQEPLWCLL
jgi:hypothetical protein